MTYTFTAAEPGTYMYHSGTAPELQIEMGLVGAIIVRPSMGEGYAYNHVDTSFDHEYMFLLSSMDPSVHQLAEQNRFGEIDMTARWPVYWFINGRAAPDDLAEPFVSWVPHQPYNCSPRMTPGQKVLVRILGADQDQHPLHLHGNHYSEIARYGRLLETETAVAPSRRGSGSRPCRFPARPWTPSSSGPVRSSAGTSTVHRPMECRRTTASIVGTNWPPGDGAYAPGDGYADMVRLSYGILRRPRQALPRDSARKAEPGLRRLVVRQPVHGARRALPPGEGGLNPNNGYFFMWHSHAEKELTNFDIFPGGMLSMMVVEPPGTPIP